MRNVSPVDKPSASSSEEQELPESNLLADNPRAARYEPLFPSETSLFPRILSPQQAVQSAQNCLLCADPAPCTLACPLQIDIPKAMNFIRQNQFLQAAAIFREKNPFAEACGRLCSEDLVCQKACNQVCSAAAPQINLLGEYVCFVERESGQQSITPGTPQDRSVAIVGSGPAGLACAETLVRSGISATIFEKMPLPGGMLRYGIPEYKLPPDWINNYIGALESVGVTFKTGINIGRDIPVDDLIQQGFSAVFIAVGCNIDSIPDIPGVDLPGVCLASEFIARARLIPEQLPLEMQHRQPLGIRILVLGGGNTALDCMRAALQIGSAEVTCVYEKSEADMPVSDLIKAEVKEAGAHFRYMTKPVRFIPDPQGNVSAVECLQCELGPPDQNGQRDSVPIPGSNFLLRADTIVVAMGVHPDPTIGKTTPGLSTYADGLITIDPATRATSRPGIFAGGDAAHGPHLVVSAVLDGMCAAHTIELSLNAASRI
ncbi:MAG: FAD-dependent oxidoreductase [Anaerolineales bacterium]|nr:FAD-dependent oxidoreductase [Anaerolineales bacterium]